LNISGIIIRFSAKAVSVNTIAANSLSGTVFVLPDDALDLNTARQVTLIGELNECGQNVLRTRFPPVKLAATNDLAGSLAAR